MSTKVYLNILSKEQVDILPVIRHFSKDYVLVGGTAIALQLGHRESIDFDLFTFKAKNQFKTINDLLGITTKPIVKLIEKKDQSHFLINSVKVTFFNFPYHVASAPLLDKINAPDLITLAAMKAFALGGRAKWKDYVDLYFLLTNEIKMKEILTRAKTLFNTEKSIVFSEKIFLEQLTYFDDVSYEEEVIYTVEKPPSDNEVKTALKQFSFDYLNLNE